MSGTNIEEAMKEMGKWAEEEKRQLEAYGPVHGKKLKTESHPPHPELAERFPRFQSRVFLLEENTPQLVDGKSVFVPSDKAKAHKLLRQERLGLTLSDVARALSISLTQANDLEQGRLRCDWKLAAKVLKEYAER